MTFKYNNVSPTSITYNGTSINVVKYNNVNVWGKPFTLTISTGSNSTITVNRTSSPNEHASTGVLTNGSIIYYGDVLQISASASSNYKIETFTVNNNTFTSGSTTTVTSNITINATAIPTIKWNVDYEGSAAGTITSIITGMDTSSGSMPTPEFSDPFLLFLDETVNSLLGSMESSKIRISGELKYTESITYTNVTGQNSSSSKVIEYNNVLLNGSITGGGTINLLGWGVIQGMSNNASGILCTSSSTSTNETDALYGPYKIVKSPNSITITKIERYY